MRRRNDGKIVLVMILVFVAFIIGAGMGVTLNFNQEPQKEDGNSTPLKNVTDEMTSNLTNDTKEFHDESNTTSYKNNSGSNNNSSLNNTTNRSVIRV